MGDEDRDPEKDRPTRAVHADSGRAPTRAFKQLPTEVLDLPSIAPPDIKKLVDPNARTRPTAMRAPLFDDDSEDGPARDPNDDGLDLHVDDSADGFSENPATEVLGAMERHPPRPPAGINENHTDPEPFQVSIPDNLRRVQEAAKGATQFDHVLDDSDGDETDTSAEGGANPFEAPTHAHALNSDTDPPGSPFRDDVVTDDEKLADGFEDPAAPSDPGLAGPYYEEIAGAFDAAKVFDPRTAKFAPMDDSFSPQMSDDWPEITLNRQPAAKPRSPFVILGVFLGVLVLTILGVGIGFRIASSGAEDEPPIWGDPIEQEKRAREAQDNGDEPESDPESVEVAVVPVPVDEQNTDDTDDGAAEDDDDDGDDDDDAAQKSTKPPLPDTLAAAIAKLDKTKVRGRPSVSVQVKSVVDRSKSGVSGLDAALKRSFSRAVQKDRHGRWRVRSKRPKRGWTFSLAMTEVERVADGADTIVRARCTATAIRRPQRRKLDRKFVAAKRLQNVEPAAVSDKAIRSLTKRCGQGLSYVVMASVLKQLK